MKRFLLTSIFSLTLVVASVGYGIPHLFAQRSKISTDEIVMGRVAEFGNTFGYTLGKSSGDERVTVRRHALFTDSEYINIEYSKDCGCISYVYWDTGKENWSLVNSGRDITLTIDDTARIVTFAQVRDKFLLAQQVLDEARDSVSKMVSN